jgi:SNF2 family DNA or RNA helicase
MANQIDFKSTEHLEKAVVTLYHYQTPDEQEAEITAYLNTMGFNGVDASFGTSVAKQRLAGRRLSEKQLNVLRKMLPKYRRQLEDRTNWQDTHLPEIIEVKKNSTGKPTLTGPGLLTLDDKGRLEFIPNVYPTNQLKGQGWRRGNQKFWTWVTHFSLDAVNLIKHFWPDITVDETVIQLLDQLLRGEELPEEIDKHPILFPFQKEAIQFLHSSPRAMLALAPGLGKTACSIFAADIAPSSDQILVVAPLTLVWNWRREIGKWLGDSSVQWHGKPAKWPEPERWVVTNYETVARNLDAFLDEAWDIVIVDESILVKNRKAKRTKAVKELTKDMELRAWELSGNPTSRFYDDLWSQLNILQPKRFRSYWRFARKYCHVWDNGWGLQITGNRPGAAKQIQDDMADIYFCRTQDQVLDLPDWLFETYEIPLYEDQWKPYQEMEAKFWADLGDDQILLSPNQLSQLTRLIQLASSPSLVGGKTRAAKWDAAIDMLEWVEKPAIIWTNFVDTAAAIQESLLHKGFTASKLTGKTPQAQREAIVDSFQDGNLDVLVAHPKVGKFGLTLTAARTAIYLERNYEGDNYYQSLHRVRRIGTTQSPLVINLLATGPKGSRTVDHIIDKVLEYRKDESFTLTTSELQTIREQ